MTTGQMMKTLDARRRRAEADLEAVDAQQRAREAAAAAAAAEQQVAQALQAEQEAARQQALQRMAELRARLDALDPPKEQQPTYAEFCAARDRWEEGQRALAELEAYKPPPPRMTHEEQQELLAELDAAVAASEHEGEGLFYHAGRLWDRSRFY